MTILGLGNNLKVKAKNEDSNKDKNSAADEAKAVLAKMEEKKKSGDCAFC